MPEDKVISEHDETQLDENTAFDSDEAETLETDGIAEGAQEEPPTEEPPPEEPTEEPEEVVEEDEDILRGKELLESQEEVVEEKVEEPKVEIPQEPPPDLDYDSVFSMQNDRDSIENYIKAIPENFFPQDTVTLADGTVLDFQDYMSQNPEFVPGVASIVHNLVLQMVANNFLASSSSAGKMIEKTVEDIDGKLFNRTLTNRTDGVPNASEIKEGEDFKKWVKDQPKEIQALGESKDPYDHIRLYKRFLNKSGLEEAKKKIAEKDAKAKANKEKFNAVHKTTIRGSQTKTGDSTLSGEEEERAAFESDDDDDF